MKGLIGTVLVTGGTGSLGQAILGRATHEKWDASFVVYSRDEVKQAALRERFPAVRCILGDVRDSEMLEAAMRGVDVVIHAAAYKRVPEAERETMACVQANVLGSMNVAREALRVGVPRTIGISTDKACQPINAYGQSKALMERLFQSVAHRVPGVAFTLVRYGNVLASTGSVIPAFRNQAEAGGPLTLTDPAMTRFWLTLDDAVDLVLAGLRLDSGMVLIPKCRASTMAVLAEAIAPGVRTEKIGNRGGEKDHEKLLNEHESPFAWETDGGFILGPLGGRPTDDLDQGYEYRSDTAPQYSTSSLRAVIEAMTLSTPTRTLPT
jgi:UDP-N-acetylglucosamine 4,6-dehydratase/5-epimerase